MKHKFNNKTMKKKHILIVDDDIKMRKLLGQFLQTHNFITTEVHDTQEAREALSTFTFDLIILDIMLPNESGIEFAKKLKSIPFSTAILMLTAMEDVKSRILGLEAGADDYLSKPFEPQELALRIKKLIERSTHLQKNEESELIKFGQVKYDNQKNVFLIGEQALPATDQEKKLLKILLKHNGCVIGREKLAKELKVNARSIDVQIKRLRDKIESYPNKPVFLQTVRGKGYLIHSDN
ncbi:MAG: response regulator transcription factor [Rickettsiales bacterium]|nr:response regulator transcription factor [Rickettsiales bacterium]